MVVVLYSSTPERIRDRTEVTTWGSAQGLSKVWSAAIGWTLKWGLPSFINSHFESLETNKFPKGWTLFHSSDNVAPLHQVKPDRCPTSSNILNWAFISSRKFIRSSGVIYIVRCKTVIEKFKKSIPSSMREPFRNWLGMGPLTQPGSSQVLLIMSPSDIYDDPLVLGRLWLSERKAAGEFFLFPSRLRAFTEDGVDLRNFRIFLVYRICVGNCKDCQEKCQKKKI